MSDIWNNAISVYLSMVCIRFRLFVIFTFITLLYSNGLSQQGTPTIINHDKLDYKGGISNWDVCFDNEKIYVANNSGLIIYDGFDWKLRPLPSNSLVRSVHVTTDRIYVGGQDEIGYFLKGSDVFVSLRDQIKLENLPLEDVWGLTEQDGFVYFISKDRIYIIGESQSKIIFTGNPVYGLTKGKSGLFFIDHNDGIFQIENQEARLYSSYDQMGVRPGELVAVDSDLYLLTDENLIYKMNDQGEVTLFENDSQAYIKKNIPTSISVQLGTVAVGTRFGGVALLKENGKAITVVDKSTGLQNNTVSKLTIDSIGNLWVATRNGVDQIVTYDRKSIVYPDGDLQGSVFDVAQVGDYVYFASNNGLYYKSVLTKGTTKYDLIPGSQGQVWGLDVIDGQVYMAHNSGAFEVNGTKLKKISPGIGAWKFVLAPDKRHLYIGTYFGVELYEKLGKSWNFIKQYQYPKESSRIIVNGEGNNLWVSHPYRGVYRMIIDEDFNLVTSDPYYGNKGLPGNKLNYVFSVLGKPIVAAETGLYEYDPLTDRFVLNEFLSNYLPSDVNIRQIQTDSNGSIWYITANEVVKLYNTESGWKKQHYPELVGQFIAGFENLYLGGDDKIIACSDEGAIIYDISSHTETQPVSTKLLSISTPNKSNLKQGIEIPFEESTIRFTYTNNYLRRDFTYSYKLDGYDKQWSAWSDDKMKVYENLPDGDYTFMVKSRNSSLVESEVEIFDLSVSPPWYRSTVALLLYGLISIAIIAGLLLIPNKKYKKEKAILRSEQEETRAELEQVKIEKMQSELDHQNAELASSTLHLVQKNATLNKVRNEIESIRKESKDTVLRKQLKKVLSTFNDDQRLEEEWENFSIHFDKVHSNFLKKLKSKYPQLSPKDQKLAAYLRMNLSTKEIAPLLNISVRGVEISRYRLRKKLELSTETNLSDWMMSFS